MKLIISTSFIPIGNNARRFFVLEFFMTFS